MFPPNWNHETLTWRAFAEIITNQELILKQGKQTMSALSDLQDSVSKLQTDVNAFVAANSGGANDSQLVALKAQVDAIDAVVNPPAPAPAS